MRGQAEFIIIIGILIVIAAVAYFVLSSGTITTDNLPASVAAEKRLVEDAVTNVGRQGADFSIKWIEQQGGYFQPDINNAVAFTTVAVSYWQRCGHTNVPTLNEITDRMEEAIEDYMRADLSSRTEYFSRNVTFDFDSMYVKANILKNSIDYSVYLPTTIRGYDIPQPYTFSVPTKLGEIYEFAKGFAEENARNRYLDHFTIASIYFSDELETQGVLTQCGDGIYQSGVEISNGLQNAVDYTLANTLWWQPMPPASSGSKVYAIESLSGKTYDQFDIGLYLHDNFKLGIANPLFMTNANSAAAVSIFHTPACFALYNFRYSVDYPVIVRVRDELTGHYFNFAVHVDVNEMLPADCAPFVSLPSSDDTGCDAGVKVVGSDGPLEDVFVSYADYYVGKTDEDGILVGSIPCDDGKLIVNKGGYAFIELDKTKDSINDTYSLKKVPEVELNFRQVDIASRYRGVFVGPTEIQVPLYDMCYISPTTDQILLNFTSSRGYYGATNIDPDSSNYDCFDPSTADPDTLANPDCDACQSNPQDAASCKACLSACSVSVNVSSTIDYLPGDFYSVKADMWDFSRLVPTGAFSTTYNLPEQDGSYFIYVPTRSMQYITEGDRTSLTSELNSKCGISNPVDTEEHTGIVNMVIGCSCGELGNMISNEFLNSCIDSSEYAGLFTGGCNVNTVKSTVLSNCGYEVVGCG
jgi:hypothetical protein